MPARTTNGNRYTQWQCASTYETNMAKVWLGLIECMSGDLPACCVVCGGEDDVEYFEREMEYRPNWPLAFLGFDIIGWHLIGAALGWFSERYNQVMPTKLPYCEDHYDYWEKRDRRQHFGILVIALGWIVPLVVTFINQNNVRLSPTWIAVGATATVLGLVIIYSFGFSIVRVEAVKKARILLAGVHPDFAGAIEEREDHGEG